MQIKRYKPLVDKLYWFISIPTFILLAATTALTAIDAPAILFITIPTDVFCIYFLVTTLFGYVELREETLFIRFGLIMKKEIPYSKIRAAVMDRRFYSESMMSLKNALEHVNIKYNTFDTVTVSVIGNDELINDINSCISKAQTPQPK